MIKSMLTSAVFAGFAAGLLAALLHFAFVQKLILLGEQYETGALVHLAGVAVPDHDHSATEAPESSEVVSEPAADGGHGEHKHEPLESDDLGFSRNGLTSLFFGLTYVGYALLMTAGFGLAASFGHQIGAREGLVWGLAGFAVVQLAPAMGLQPELPGTMAADLAARQIWWMGTAIATAVALGLAGYGKGFMPWGIAVLLLVIPHVIGAPTLEGYSGIAPPELASAFAARSMGVGLIVWLVLGSLAGHFWSAKAV